MKNEHIIVERAEYEALLVRLDCLENKLKLLKDGPEDESGKKRTFWEWFWGKEVMALLMALVMVSILGVGAWGTAEISSLWDGNNYLRNSEIARRGYIIGASDAFAAGYSTTRMNQFKKCTRGMTGEQIYAIVEKFLRDKPQHRHKAMASLVMGAVLESCP